jgi:hypothetical protein
VSERHARIALALLALALGLGTLAVDLPRAARGELWGDSATYHAMAWSLAHDRDLRYDAGDLAQDRILASMRLFAQEVMPALA